MTQGFISHPFSQVYFLAPFSNRMAKMTTEGHKLMSTIQLMKKRGPIFPALQILSFLN